MNRNTKDQENYLVLRHAARTETDPAKRAMAEKAALYFSDAHEAKAVGMLDKARQYRRQAEKWASRYFTARSHIPAEDRLSRLNSAVDAARRW